MCNNNIKFITSPLFFWITISYTWVLLQDQKDGTLLLLESLREQDYTKFSMVIFMRLDLDGTW